MYLKKKAPLFFFFEEKIRWFLRKLRYVASGQLKHQTDLQYAKKLHIKITVDNLLYIYFNSRPFN